MDKQFKTHGMFSWCELMSKNVDESKSFYSELLGWEMEDTPLGGGIDYTIMKADGQEIGGMMALPQEAINEGAHPYWGTYVTVDDVDAVAKKAEELGGKVLIPPMDVPDIGRFATIMDSQGAVLAVISYTCF